MPAKSLGVDVWGAEGETKCGVSYKNATGKNANPIETYKESASSQTLISLSKATQSDCGQEHQEASHNEVGDLDPAEIAKAQHAQGMPGHIKAFTSQDLGESDNNVDGPGNYAAGEQELV